MAHHTNDCVIIIIIISGVTMGWLLRLVTGAPSGREGAVKERKGYFELEGPRTKKVTGDGWVASLLGSSSDTRIDRPHANARLIS